MAKITKPSQYPNLLVLSGTEIVRQTPNGWHIRRKAIKDLLFTDSNGIPSFAGQVDFIACFVVNGEGLDYGGFDHSIKPRPLRGIVQLDRDVRHLSPSQLGIELGWVAHEVAHYWLVPGRAKIRTSEGAIETPTPDEIAESLNAGQGIPDYAIIGRTDNHWSPFIDGQNSPMEGLPHSPTQELFEAGVGYAYSETHARTGVTFDVEGFGPVTTRVTFNDLELYIMGVLAEPDFRPSQSIVRYMRPRWVYPVNFQTGLYAEVDNGDIWYLGFNRGPHRLTAQRIDGYVQVGPTDLSVPFNPYDRVGFRIVQQGSEVLLQARVWKRELYHRLYGCLWEILNRIGLWIIRNPVRDNLAPLTCDQLLNDVVTGSLLVDPNVYMGWKTLATINGRVSRLGLASRHLSEGGTSFARTRARLCLWDGGGIRSIPTTDLTVENGIPPNDDFEARTVLDDGTFVLPYRTAPGNAVKFFHTTQTDEAPRLVMAAPESDFAFGGDVEIAECTLTTWAGGDGLGKHYVGSRGMFTFADFDLQSQWNDSDDTIRRTPPQANTYRMLFCLVSANELLSSELQPYLDGLDLVRRAWEPCFNEFTKGQRFADTTI